MDRRTALQLLKTDLFQWFSVSRDSGHIIHDVDIQVEALAIAKRREIYNFQASLRWIQSFKKVGLFYQQKCIVF